MTVITIYAMIGMGLAIIFTLTVPFIAATLWDSVDLPRRYRGDSAVYCGDDHRRIVDEAAGGSEIADE